jgi:serine/threonine protein kinase
MHFKRLPAPVCYPIPTVESVQCLDDNAVSEFVSGTLAATAVTKVEHHLAGCRDCRALVAALAGSDDHDSNAQTRPHDKPAEDSQVAKRPVLSVGDRVGRYLVLSTLGAGGMGVVFAAYDPQLDRKVALKLLRANLGANAKEARTRLKREAQAIAQLNHPNVVGVYDVGTTNDGDVYIAMEFVEGDTLTAWLDRYPRSWREILEVFQQAGQGLMAAHSVGLLHRDFKPDNVLVGGDGRVRVTDFGLARSVFLEDSARGAATLSAAEAIASRPGSESSPSGRRPAPASPLHVDLTATGTVLGTPRYMPPEQLTGPTIDARADQFSFCVALYEALYATHPLPGKTSVAMLEHGEKALPPPDSSKVPATIARAVLRGLDKERSKRFPTMAALMHELAPPPQRAPVRLIALASLAVVAVGGAAAAVIARPEQVRRGEGNDEAVVQRLYAKIQQLEEEREQLKHALLEANTNLRELPALKSRLAEKDGEIQQLVVQVAELRARQAKLVKAAVPARQVEDAQITAAIGEAAGSIAFCFRDYDSRPQAMRPTGAPAAGNFDAVVRIGVSPAGRGAEARATGLDFAPSVKLCVQDALDRVRYPAGPERLVLQIAIAWKDAALDMTARVVGRSEPTVSTLEDL